MPARKSKKRSDNPVRRRLGAIDARYERLPASRVQLSPAERKLLRDPDWIDEDEADLILALRDEENLKLDDAIDIREFIRVHGREAKRPA